MDLQNLASEIESICDNEAATGDAGHLRNVRGLLERLASYVARREQAIEARLAGCCDTALGLETRADAQIGDIATDASGMVRPIQPGAYSMPAKRLPTLDGPMPTQRFKVGDLVAVESPTQDDLGFGRIVEITADRGYAIAWANGMRGNGWHDHDLRLVGAPS